MNNIAIILGTRPEAIKLLPVYMAFKQLPAWQTTLISTGQHREMLQTIFDFYELKPDIELDVMQPNQTLSTLSAALLQKLDTVFANNKFDAVIVQGDTTTCMIGSLTAFYHQIKVVHVEAGLRTYNKWAPYPEEINRKITGVIADIHFAPTQRAADALHKEAITGHVYVVGNTVIDSLIFTAAKVNANEDTYLQKFAGFVNANQPLVLITGHRRESFGEGFRNICEAIATLAAKHPEVNFVYPVHLNPNVKEIVFSQLSDKKNIHLIEPLPYDELVFLMARSYLIMTDSGGIQEEAPTFGKPVIVLRETTERPEGVEAGCSVLCGTNVKHITEVFNRLLTDRDFYAGMSNTSNPYGDGTSSQQIATIMADYFKSVAIS